MDADMMRSLLLTKKQSDEIWDWVDDTLHFWPDIYRGHDFPRWKPFEIPVKHAVYGFENMNEENFCVMDDLIDRAFINVTTKGQKIYALDWNHEGFLYDPRVIRENDHRLWFLEYYPDGDYYFFIDEHKTFGYLSHPWRREVWIFGDALLKEFQCIYRKLGWDLLYEFDPVHTA